MKCWSCGAVMSGDHASDRGRITCDRCGWESLESIDD